MRPLAVSSLWRVIGDSNACFCVQVRNACALSRRSALSEVEHRCASFCFERAKYSLSFGRKTEAFVEVIPSCTPPVVIRVFCAALSSFRHHRRLRCMEWSGIASVMLGFIPCTRLNTGTHGRVTGTNASFSHGNMGEMCMGRMERGVVTGTFTVHIPEEYVAFCVGFAIARGKQAAHCCRCFYTVA